MEEHQKPVMYIIYSLFLSEEGDKQVIGGIQKYILGLIKVFNKSYNVIIIQKANRTFVKEFEDYKVLGFNIQSKRKPGKELFIKIKAKLKSSDYIIWASDRISVKTKHKNTISIQHGITFDFIDYSNIRIGSLLKEFLLLSIFYRILQQFSALKYFSRTTKVVCVDYNYLNWIRVVLPRKITDKAVVIPNFSELPKLSLITPPAETIKILFARRFVDYRGVYILCEVIESILKKYDNIEFGVYGEGPLENYLIEKVGNYDNVTISSYNAENSLEIQLKYNISLIPTFGSEGTSLSLIESMACGCVPIASNVGGMTNVIIDEYNGFLVNPTTKEFCEKIEFLIDNDSEMRKMSKNARATIENGFSFQKWQKKWQEVIKVRA